MKIGIHYEAVKNGKKQFGEVSVEAPNEAAGKRKFVEDFKDQQVTVIGTRVIHTPPKI